MFSNRKIILLILLLVSLCIAAYVLVVVIPRRVAEQSYEGARRIGHDLKEAFQFTPQITVNNTIVLQQQASILELATVSQKFQHQYIWKNTWMKSTKEIRITETFEAKAGFDLNRRFTITINDDKATVIFPEPQLLSVEPLGDMELKDEQGVWNWIHESDRAQAVNAFTQDARRYATEAAFVHDAGKHMEERLLEILKPYVSRVEIQMGNVRIDRELKK